MRIVVIGGPGAMGQVIVRDLVESKPVKEVVIADFDEGKAKTLQQQLKSNKLSTAFVDITDVSKVTPALKGASVVINSTPYYYNVNVMEAALQAGCHYVDLGGLFHVSRKQLELDERFKKADLLAAIGMGAAPGMTNVMAAYAAEDMDTVESIDIAIGCIDFAVSNHPLAPPYALDTIIDEYTKEPMVFEDGEFKAVVPMSGEISIDFPEPVGRSKAIYTLHSEVATLPLSYKRRGIKRVTFRLGLPAEFHERLKFLMDLGFGSSDKIDTADGAASPRKILAKMIERFPAASVEPDDCEVVRVDVRGRKDGNETMVRMETTIFPHPQWKISCGALDTGVPPSVVAQMIAQNEIMERGVLPPELCVPAQPFFAELNKRTITMRKITEQSLQSNKQPVAAL